MPVYATREDLPESVDPPDNVEDLLLLASGLVDTHLLTAVYSVDPEGQPTDEELRDTFRRAVVAQVVTWSSLGLDPTLGAAGVNQKAQVASKSLGTGSVAYQASSARAEEDRVQALGLSQFAQAMLDAALRKSRIEVRG